MSQFIQYKEKYIKNHYGDKKSVHETSTNDSLLTFVSTDVNEGKRADRSSNFGSYHIFDGSKKQQKE